MEGIQERLVSSCMPVMPMWYGLSSRMPMSSGRNVKRSERICTVRSRSFGVNTIRAAPTTGRNTATLSPE